MGQTRSQKHPFIVTESPILWWTSPIPQLDLIYDLSAKYREIIDKNSKLRLRLPTLNLLHLLMIPIEVFIFYSHRDEDLKHDLWVHLAILTRQGKIKLCQSRAIEAVPEWNTEITTRLESARVILLLITSHFIASESFDRTIQWVMAQHDSETAQVIPILMEPCDWWNKPFSKFQVLPRDATPITACDRPDEALLNVVRSIDRVVEFLAKE